MTATCVRKGMVTYPVDVIKVNGIRCLALLDSGAGSSYASSALLDCMRIRLLQKEFKRIEMMLGATNKVIDIYGLSIKSVDDKFRLETEVTKVDHGKLFTQEKPKHKEVIANFSHLKDVTMDDVTNKPDLPVHLMLGTSEYAKIKDSALGIKRLFTTSLRSSLLGVWRAGMKPVCHGKGITLPCLT